VSGEHAHARAGRAGANKPCSIAAGDAGPQAATLGGQRIPDEAQRASIVEAGRVARASRAIAYARAERVQRRGSTARRRDHPMPKGWIGALRNKTKLDDRFFCVPACQKNFSRYADALRARSFGLAALARLEDRKPTAGRLRRPTHTMHTHTRHTNGYGEVWTKWRASQESASITSQRPQALSQ
jgi:hypothetical protein